MQRLRLCPGQKRYSSLRRGRNQTVAMKQLPAASMSRQSPMAAGFWQ
jgi:hypothetical protein